MVIIESSPDEKELFAIDMQEIASKRFVLPLPLGPVIVKIWLDICI